VHVFETECIMTRVYKVIQWFKVVVLAPIGTGSMYGTYYWLYLAQFQFVCRKQLYAYPTPISGCTFPLLTVWWIPDEWMNEWMNESLFAMDNKHGKNHQWVRTIVQRGQLVLMLESPKSEYLRNDFRSIPTCMIVILQWRLHHTNDGANAPWKKYFCSLFQELRGRRSLWR